MSAFLASLMFVVLAEMGDKTQLLAMAFATKYTASKVLLGVSIATILNHALAVALGKFLSNVVPFDVISTVAALSFIFFGLWTIRGDQLDGEDRKASKFGPILTVAIAFFIAELGDKTQLSTISLAIQYNNSLAVLMGTTTGMLIADGIGIIIGILLGKKIPENVVKWVSAGVFIAFGFVGLWNGLTAFFNMPSVVFTLTITALMTAVSIYYLVGRNKKSCQ